jgi:phosphohistidine phosphatase SixA
MKVILVHHVDALKAEQDPQRHISPKGHAQAERLAARFKALGLSPVRILHSEAQWVTDTAVVIAQKMGLGERAAKAAYPINTGDSVAPFLAEIAATKGDLMMCGHIDFLLRAVAKIVCGDEKRKVFDFKPGNGTAVCIEGEGSEWSITWAWRQDHAPG